MADFKPPLSFEELKEIQDRNRDNADVRRLLWEIKRLHAVVSRANQLVRSIGPDPHGTALQIIAWATESEIKDDPVVIARNKMNEELFGQKVEPGDDD
jgi:hypothetical protein